MANGEYQHIDMAFLENFTSGDSAKMAKYINMFVKAAPGQIKTMKSQCESQDWNSLRTTAHSLKPQAGYMGAGELKELFLRIEKYAGEQVNLAAVPDLIEQIETISAQAINELEQVVENLSA
jgi:HPt (histidine-containing phosphotransfer) domain-containing protein